MATGTWHRDFVHSSACCSQVSALRLRLDPTRLLLAPVGKQGLEQSIHYLLFMDRKMRALTLHVYIPELCGVFFFFWLDSMIMRRQG